VSAAAAGHNAVSCNKQSLCDEAKVTVTSQSSATPPWAGPQTCTNTSSHADTDGTSAVKRRHIRSPEEPPLRGPNQAGRAHENTMAAPCLSQSRQTRRPATLCLHYGSLGMPCSNFAHACIECPDATGSYMAPCRLWCKLTGALARMNNLRTIWMHKAPCSNDTRASWTGCSWARSPYHHPKLLPHHTVFSGRQEGVEDVALGALL